MTTTNTATQAPGSPPSPTEHRARLRIVLADDHRMVLSALRVLLGTRPHLQILAEVSDTDALLNLTELALADLVVLDLNLPEPSTDRRAAELPGLRVLPLIRARSRAKVLVLSMHDESMVVLRALNLGAQGFVTKGSPGERLFDAIDAMERGQTYVDPSILSVSVPPPPPQPVGGGSSSAGTDGPARLSRQEREVGSLLLAGMTQKAIGYRLGISPQTTHTYKRRLKEKLGAASDAELLRKLPALLEEGA